MGAAASGQRIFLIVALAAWGALVAWGSIRALDYENAPGEAAAAPAVLPANLGPPSLSQPFTLLLIGHPDCPCTEASVAELSRLVALLHDRLRVIAIFYKPGAAPNELQSSPLWREVAAIPGVTVRCANGADEIMRLGAKVSGQTMLYDGAGHLVFSGGITSARGHEGDNYGMQAIVDLVRGRRKGMITAPVFGCPLFDPDATTLKKDPSWKIPTQLQQ